MIRTKKLDIGFKDESLILHSDIEVSLQKGELTCLLGPNGAGKSTLLKTFAGILQPLKGEIFIENENAKHYKLAELARKVSVVLTDRSQLMNMQVREVVAAGRHPYTGFFGKLKKTDLEIITRAIHQVGLETLTSRKLYELSDGERQKCMIAKALAQETPIILLDEPTAFLDLPSKIEMMRLLHKLATESPKAILMSTHDMDLALKFADKLWLMAKNMPLISGNTEDLVIRDQINAFFGKKDIFFDKETGSFKLKNGLNKKVQLIGHGIERTWISNALMRNGFSIDAKAEIEIHIIDNGKREFLMKYQGKDKIVKSIEDVIIFLKEII